MIGRDSYTPGPATAAHVEKNGDDWTLVIVKNLRHSAAIVWHAITDPEQLREWAPFDADGNLAAAGRKVRLTTVGAPQPHVTETTVIRSEAPHLLEYKWGNFDMRWQLESTDTGTRLTLWTKIDRRYIAMGAAGWHICLDVLDHLLANEPIGRLAGPAAMQVNGWQRLHAEYTQQFGVKP